MKKIEKNTSFIFSPYAIIFVKIVFILILHVVVSFIVNLPYINIFANLIGFLPFIIDWVAITILFKPSPQIVFLIGAFSLLLSFPFLILKSPMKAEIFGNISYLMFVTYIFLTIGTLKAK